MAIHSFLDGYFFSLETMVRSLPSLPPFNIPGTHTHDIYPLIHPSLPLATYTQATVGYGANDLFFGDCLSPAIAITAQIYVSIFIDAVFIGIIFLRFSRPQKKSRTIICSRVALMNRLPTSCQPTAAAAAVGVGGDSHASGRGGGPLALSIRISELTLVR